MLDISKEVDDAKDSQHSKEWLTRRDREVIAITRSRVKTKSKLTNLMNNSQIEGYNGK